MKDLGFPSIIRIIMVNLLWSEDFLCVIYPFHLLHVDAKLYTIHDFVFAVKIDNLNLFKVSLFTFLFLYFVTTRVSLYRSI